MLDDSLLEKLASYSQEFPMHVHQTITADSETVTVSLPESSGIEILVQEVSELGLLGYAVMQGDVTTESGRITVCARKIKT